MKRTVLVLLAIVTFVVIVPTAAKTGGVNDENVDYIYWDQTHINTYWTGVTNKIDANDFKPCVGVVNAGGACSATAYKAQYKEYGLSVLPEYFHVHYLFSRWNTVDYYVE